MPLPSTILTSANIGSKPGSQAIDLFRTANELTMAFGDALHHRNFEDAFLYLAGIQQIVDDKCSRAEQVIRRAAPYWESKESNISAIAAKTASKIDQQLHNRRRRDWSDIEPCVKKLRSAVERFADAIVNIDAYDISTELECIGTKLIPCLLSISDKIPAAILRIPSCFRSFDQHPCDILALTKQFSRQYPDKTRPIVVIGVRTSGSYLGPLTSAAFRRLGYKHVKSRTARPHWPIESGTIHSIEDAIYRDGIIVVTDDPPTSGKSLRQVIRQIESIADCPTRSIVLLLALFNNGGLPPSLAEVPSITLPLSQWQIRRSLTREMILQRLVNDAHLNIKSIELSEANLEPRGHAKAIFRAHIDNGRTVEECRVTAQGLGYGYFADQSFDVATRIPNLVPDIACYHDGVLVSVLPPKVRELKNADASCIDAISNSIVEHHFERKSNLQVPEDRSKDLAGRLPVWEVAADIVSRNLGPLGKIARPIIVEKPVKTALSHPEASLVDGFPFAGWYWSDQDRLKKSDLSDGPYSHLDLATYDAVYDVAGMAVALDRLGIADSLKRSWEQLDREIGSSRWMLLQLVHTWNAKRLCHISESTFRRIQSRILQRYFRELYLKDIEPATTGPLIAIDLDGVLETSPLGFPAATEQSIAAVRALLAHGHTVVICTGRSVDEVEERIRNYRTCTGVAEYGAYVIDANMQRHCLLTDDEQERLVKLRQAINASHPEFEIDRDYHGLVRVYRLTHGRRRGLSRQEAFGLLAQYGVSELFRVYCGEEQTDIVPKEINKARGLMFLLSTCNYPTGLQDAIGDSDGDLEMLLLAERSWVPSNASHQARQVADVILTKGYQHGLAECVSRIIRHPIGACEQCRIVPLEASDSAIVELLSIHEGGRLELLKRIFRFFVGAMRSAIS